MKINEVINYVQNILNKGVKSDDSIYSDRFVYFIIKNLRARLIRERYSKYHIISPFNYQFIDCLALEKTIIPDCICVTSDCKYLKTKVQLPRTITTRNEHLLEVYTAAGERIYESTIEASKYNKYSKTKKNKDYFFVHNNHIVLVTENNSLKNISVKGIFEDPVELAGVEQCSSIPCYDPYVQDFPLDQDLVESIGKMAADEVHRYMNTSVRDMENDAKETPQGK